MRIQVIISLTAHLNSFSFLSMIRHSFYKV